MRVKPNFNKLTFSSWKEFFTIKRDDTEFEKEHPNLNIFFDVISSISINIPIFTFIYLSKVVGPIALLGVLGGLFFGYGINSIVLAYTDQYLGHKITIISILIGLFLMSTGLYAVLLIY